MGRASEVSAGLLVFRRGKAPEVLPEVFLAHPGGPFWAKKDAGAWGIPKGLIEAGADPLTTAQREFTEETGFVAQGPFIELTAVRQKSGKLVHAFACAGDFDPARLVSNTFEIQWPPRSTRMKSFPEIDRAAWFDLATARAKIIPYQLPLLAELESKLHNQG